MWPNPQFSTDLVTFTEEIINGKLHFLFSAKNYQNILFLSRSNHMKIFVKNGVLKTFTETHICSAVLFLSNRTPLWVFSSESCKKFQKSYSVELLYKPDLTPFLCVTWYPPAPQSLHDIRQPLRNHLFSHIAGLTATVLGHA